jgi:hypothetical protein
MISNMNGSYPSAVSVCIAARNESPTIRAAIDSIRAQRFPIGRKPEIEVIVFANACTDNTAQIVRGLARKQPDLLRLIETDVAGKPNAWNELRRAARHEYVFFVDGDVVVDPHAFHKILAMHAQRPDLVLLNGLNAWDVSKCDFLTRLSLPPDDEGIVLQTWQATICARLYGCWKKGLDDALLTAGYRNIPVDTIGADRWLRCVLDRAASRDTGIPVPALSEKRARTWAICRQALVYSVPPDWWRDKPRVRARLLHAQATLRYAFPECYEQKVPVGGHQPTSAAERIRQRFARVRTLLAAGGPHAILRGIMDVLAERRARRLFDRSQNVPLRISAENWISAGSSKVVADNAVR